MEAIILLTGYNSHTTTHTTALELRATHCCCKGILKKAVVAACAIKAHADLEEQVGEERTGAGK